MEVAVLYLPTFRAKPKYVTFCGKKPFAVVCHAYLVGKEQGRDGEDQRKWRKQPTEEYRQYSQCPEVLWDVLVLGGLILDHLSTLEGGICSS